MGRAFTRNDLVRVPDGWNVVPPAFIGIGVPKAGTTWWYDLMLSHPNIVDNRLRVKKTAFGGYSKELTYFLHMAMRNMTQQEKEAYQHAFAAPDGSICGEYSTTYLGYPMCVAHIAKVAPQAKIIVILRNPIDRTLSHMNHLVRNRGKLLKIDDNMRDLFLTFPVVAEATLHSRYAIGLKQLLKYYPKDQVLVLLYEKNKEDYKKEIRKTFDFLGLDPDFVPEDGASRVVNRQDYVLPRFSKEERGRLAEYFRDDVRDTLELFPELEAAYWPDFEQVL